jgi:copper(I)-binding protein
MRAKPIALLVALIGAVVLLAGCAAGQRAQTAIETPVLDGVGANVGSIDLRALTIANPASGSYPSGGTATLQLYIVNNGAADQLVSVSSPSAKSAKLFLSTTDEFPLPTPTATGAKTSTSATGTNTSAAASSSTAPTTSAAPTTSSPAPSTSASTAPVMIAIPAGETTIVGVVTTQPQITLSGLTTALYPAMSIPITFTFANAGSVTVMVSVHLSTGTVNAPTLATSHESTED